MLSPLLQPSADADTLLSAAGLAVSKALGVGTWSWWAWRNRGEREDMDFSSSYYPGSSAIAR
jgi:hypothetical protein